ncbi:MAG: hypothetical protein IIB41_06575 [Candidatus Marinimicrobia bacterium]|nr:hypothetical protein [Candidatus Neomarinimicrobiota bacterium]
MTELVWLSDYIVALAVIGTGIFLRAYLKKKAENLATKDDIGEITAKIEDVKHDYAARLESLRSTFQAKLQIDHVRYQNEYLILSDSRVYMKYIELRKKPNPPSAVEVEQGEQGVE